jgi:hypothetical protein
MQKLRYIEPLAGALGRVDVGGGSSGATGNPRSTKGEHAAPLSARSAEDHGPEMAN